MTKIPTTLKKILNDLLTPEPWVRRMWSGDATSRGSADRHHFLIGIRDVLTESFYNNIAGSSFM